MYVIVPKRRDKITCINSTGINVLPRTPDRRINSVRNSHGICESPGEGAETEEKRS